MNNLRKLFALLLAVMMLAAVTLTVFAESAPSQGTDGDAPADNAPDAQTEPKDGDDEDSGEITTTGAIDATTTGEADDEGDGAPEGYSMGLFVLDGEGNPVQTSSGLASCLGGGSATLYIKHDYKIVAKYYNSKGEQLDAEKELILGFEDESGNVSLEHNCLNIKASDETYSFTFSVFDKSKDGKTASYPVKIERFNFSVTDLLLAALAVYLIVTVFRGSGSMFSDEFIKEDKKEQFKKLTRLLAIVTAVALIASGVLGICFAYLDWVRIAKYVLFGIAAVCLIGMFVLSNVFTDKEKRDKAQQTARTGGGNASKAAFEFDGTEPTIDDVLADIEKQKSEEK